MQVRIIKGTKQIGGCITEISVNNSKIIIDFGNDLEESNELFELDGLTKGKSKYDAVFISHSHIDHIGLINKINRDIPVYVEKTSLNIYNLTCDFCNRKRVTRKVNIFLLNHKQIFDNGDIKVTPYMCDHSAYNSCMFLVEGDGKSLLFTGDFRNHGRKGKGSFNLLRNIGKVDMLITEGTTLTRCIKKNMSEYELEDKIVKIMKKYHEVLVMQSSTNLDRTVSFLKASIKTNKKFIVDLFSYHLQNIINRFINIDNKNVFLWKAYKYRNKDKYVNIDSNIKGAFPYFAMEIKESMLTDIKKLYQKGLLKNACLIYSMWDGYLKKDAKLSNFINELRKMNIDIIFLHTSGHADKEAFKVLNEMVNPKKTIIIHTKDIIKGKELFNNVISICDNEYVLV